MKRIKSEITIIVQLLLVFVITSCDKYIDLEEPPVNRLYTSEVVNIIGNEAVGGGEIKLETDIKIVDRGVCWNTSGNPTIYDSYISNGNGIGTYVSHITGLEINTIYYIRAFATCENGKTYYGNERNFATTDELYPDIRTRNITDITFNSAVGGGIIVFEGNPAVTKCGVCWSTNTNPTIKDYYVSVDVDGGDYILDITELEANTTYYVRAYVYCGETEKYFYAEQKIFTTQNKTY